MGVDLPLGLPYVSSQSRNLKSPFLGGLGLPHVRSRSRNLKSPCRGGDLLPGLPELSEYESISRNLKFAFCLAGLICLSSQSRNLKSPFYGWMVDLPPGRPNMSSRTFRCGHHSLFASRKTSKFRNLKTHVLYYYNFDLRVPLKLHYLVLTYTKYNDNVSKTDYNDKNIHTSIFLSTCSTHPTFITFYPI